MSATAGEHPDTFTFAYLCSLCGKVVEVPEMGDHTRTHKAAPDWTGSMSWLRVEKQQRGPIMDYLGALASGLALCKCVHGKCWPEGDDFEPNEDNLLSEGLACRECCKEWHDAQALKTEHAE